MSVRVTNFPHIPITTGTYIEEEEPSHPTLSPFFKQSSGVSWARVRRSMYGAVVVFTLHRRLVRETKYVHW